MTLWLTMPLRGGAESGTRHVSAGARRRHVAVLLRSLREDDAGRGVGSLLLLHVRVRHERECGKCKLGRGREETTCSLRSTSSRRPLRTPQSRGHLVFLASQRIPARTVQDGEDQAQRAARQAEDGAAEGAGGAQDGAQPGERMGKSAGGSLRSPAQPAASPRRAARAVRATSRHPHPPSVVRAPHRSCASLRSRAAPRPNSRRSSPCARTSRAC